MRDWRNDFYILYPDVDTIELNEIFMNVLNVDFSQMLSISSITDNQFESINIAIKKFVTGMPVTRIFEKAYFYGEQFKINKFVLSPRADTEILVENAIDIIKKFDKKDVLDLCCGSGAIGIIVAKKTNAKVVLSDISKDALTVAEYNAKNIDVKVDFVLSDMFQNFEGRKYDCILSNPPYIETNTINTLENGVKLYDPLISLDGGADGLFFYKIIAKEYKNYLKDDGYLMLEIGFNQSESVKRLFDNCDIELIKDIGGKDRLLIIKRK